MELKTVEKLIKLAKKHKASYIKFDTIEIKFNDDAFKKEVSLEEIKELYDEKSESDDDLLYYSAN